MEKRDLIRTRKICNVLSILLTIMFFVTLIANFNTLNGKEKYYKDIFYNLSTEANIYNNNIPRPSNVIKEKPKYTNGFDAAVAGWNNFYSLSCYSISQSGKVVTNAPVVGEFVFASSTKGAVWSDGLIYSEVNSLKISGSGVFDKTQGKAQYQMGDKKYEQYSPNRPYYKNGVLCADYNNNWTLSDKKDDVSTLAYHIDATTIERILYFNIQYTPEGKISHYEISLTLNPKGYEDYANKIKETANLKCLPTFKECTLSMIILPDDTVSVLRVKETYTATADLFGGISTDMKDDFLFKIFDQNIEPTHVKRPI